MSAYHDIHDEILTHVLGFSSLANLVGGPFTNIANIPIALKKTPQILKNAIFGFEEQEKIKNLHINIKFKNFRKLLEDRNESIKYNVGIEFSRVKANILFDEKKYKAEIRLKGQGRDHWRNVTRMSFRVSLMKDDTIFGYKSFSIQKPGSRDHPYDQVFQKSIQKLGNLSPSHNYVHLFVNGKDQGIMNIEEHMSKELLEKQQVKESLIMKFQADKKWIHNMGQDIPGKDVYRYSDPGLFIKVFNDKKYIKQPIYRKYLSYIANKHLDDKETKLYDTDSFTKALLLAYSWNQIHTLKNGNSRYYFNPYTIKLEPITTDQLRFSSIKVPLCYSDIPDIYHKVIWNKEFKNSIDKNYNNVLRVINKTQSYIDEYQNYFPLDQRIKVGRILLDNLNSIKSEKDKYFFCNPDKIYTGAKNSEIKSYAGILPQHIHARHFDNGQIHIYNLVKDKVRLLNIYANGKKIKKFKARYIDSYFSKEDYNKVIIQTGLNGIYDKKIVIVTEYLGNIRKHIIDYTFNSNEIHNPLLNNFKSSSLNFVTKISKDTWKIKKGNWSVNNPLVFDGNLIIDEGVNLSFSNNSYLIIKGFLKAEGTQELKIILNAKEGYWKGVYVLNSDDKSYLSNVEIKNTKSLSDGVLSLTGGVSFYKSDVNMTNTSFYNSIAEDSLNIIHSNFILNNVVIDSSISDGFDSDFSSGEIINSKFMNIGGDAVDFSGSNVGINDTVFLNIYDKSISVGEASNIKLNNIKISGTGVGVASKDGSDVVGSNIEIDKYKMYSLMTYVKKGFYTNPNLDLNNVKTDNKENDFSRQQGSKMIVNGKNIEPMFVNVKDLYSSGIMKK